MERLASSPERHPLRRRRVERDLARAARCADKVMIDVPADYPGREALWFLHFYGTVSQQSGLNEPLAETIEHFAEEADWAAGQQR